jgi:hypothetical protein
MKEKIIEIIKEKQKEYEFNSSPYNALRELEERIKGLTQPSEKPSAEEIERASWTIARNFFTPEDDLEMWDVAFHHGVKWILNQYANQ